MFWWFFAAGGWVVASFIILKFFSWLKQSTDYQPTSSSLIKNRSVFIILPYTMEPGERERLAETLHNVLDPKTRSCVIVHSLDNAVRTAQDPYRIEVRERLWVNGWKELEWEVSTPSNGVLATDWATLPGSHPTSTTMLHSIATAIQRSLLEAVQKLHEIPIS